MPIAMRKTSLYLLWISLLSLTACDKLDAYRKQIAAGQESSQADNEVNKAFNALNTQVQNAENKTLNLYYLPDSAKVTVNLTSRTAVIDFGSVGLPCPEWDGKTRKGKLLLSWTGAYRDSGTVITLTTQNYHVDGDEVIINHVATNRGKNAQNQGVYAINAQATVQTSSGAFTWASTRTHTWTAGEATLTPFDDVYRIEGSASGTIRTGESYTVNTRNDDPLILNVGCRRRLVDGTLDITVQNIAPFQIDYGNGSCLSPAYVRIDGRTYTIVY
jgi:hypothetical protein